MFQIYVSNFYNKNNFLTCDLTAAAHTYFTSKYSFNSYNTRYWSKFLMSTCLYISETHSQPKTPFYTFLLAEKKPALIRLGLMKCTMRSVLRRSAGYHVSRNLLSGAILYLGSCSSENSISFDSNSSSGLISKGFFDSELYREKRGVNSWGVTYRFRESVLPNM